MGPTILGEGVWGVVLVEMGEFSSFSRFSVELANFDRVSRSVIAVGGVSESRKVADGVVGERTVIFCEISVVVALVVLIFAFFPNPGSARACDVAT